MMWKTSLLMVVCSASMLLIGYFCGRNATEATRGKAESARHWKRVEAYRDYLNDPANEQLDQDAGLTFVTIPFSPEPSLMALAAAGEIEHVQLVFPNVPRSNRRTNRYWMDYLDRDDVLYVTAPMSYTNYATTGEQPLLLNIWFKEEARSAIQRLIVDLEQLAVSEEFPMPPVSPVMLRLFDRAKPAQP